MQDSLDLISIAIAFFVAAASPGPATLASATVSMSQGRKAGLVFGLGLSLGLAFWGVVAATGLGALLQTSSNALFILKIAGGIYLLWLAYTSAKSAIKQQPSNQFLSGLKGKFGRGLLLNLSNPKAVFAWMAVLALGLGEESSTLHLWAATLCCIALGFLIYAAYAFAFSTRRIMTMYQKIQKWVQGAAALLFAFAGFNLIRSAIVRQ